MIIKITTTTPVTLTQWVNQMKKFTAPAGAGETIYEPVKFPVNQGTMGIAEIRINVKEILKRFESEISYIQHYTTVTQANGRNITNPHQKQLVRYNRIIDKATVDATLLSVNPLIPANIVDVDRLQQKLLKATLLELVSTNTFARTSESDFVAEIL